MWGGGSTLEKGLEGVGAASFLTFLPRGDIRLFLSDKLCMLRACHNMQIVTNSVYV